MRLFRALTRLLLALAYVSVGTAPSHAGLCPPAAASSHHQHHGATVAEPVVHDHGGHAARHPTGEHDGCRSMCCVTAVRLPIPAPGASAVAFVSPVRYAIRAEPLASRGIAPDPEIPKPLA